MCSHNQALFACPHEAFLHVILGHRERDVRWRRLGRSMGQTNAGFSPRRPEFVTRVKPKVSVDLF